MTVIAKCKNISKEYGDKTILKSIDLELVQGEKIGIVGVNGAGKTTLANILTGKLEPTSGEVIWYKSGIQVGYMQQATDYMNLKSTLSGGEKTRKLLTEVLYSKNDLLLLDEPTNHLDYESVKWLIKKVKAFRGTVVIISHDRYFLDQCVTRTIEIENGVALEYKGNYSCYREEKLRQYESHMHRYIEQEKIKERIRGQITELRGWSSKAHRESARKARGTGNKFGGKEYNRVKAKKMDKAIKSLLGEETIEGEIRMGKSRHIGYISQDVLGLDESQTIQGLFPVANNQETAKIRAALSKMGFASEDCLKEVGCLSLGERMKLKLLKMILEGCEVLVLEKLCNKLLVFKNKQIIRYEYGIKEYLEKTHDKTNHTSNNREKVKIEERMILENRIAYVIGRLSKLEQGAASYELLDKEYHNLIHCLKGL